jgi:hypothetical protein
LTVSSLVRSAVLPTGPGPDRGGEQAGKAGLAGCLLASLDGCFFPQLVHSMNRKIDRPEVT